MQKELSTNKKPNTFSEFKKRIYSLLSPFLKLFTNVKFLILLLVITFIANSFIVFRINYSEDYLITYRYERPTVLLNNENYIELYRFHDYVQYRDKTVTSVLAANYDLKSEVKTDPLFGVNSGSEEIAYGDKADIKTNINRINGTNFEIVRTITFKNSPELSSITDVYIELILGGEDINVFGNTIMYKDCKLEVTYPANLFPNYKESEKVITFSTLKGSKTEVVFKLSFNLSCE